MDNNMNNNNEYKDVNYRNVDNGNTANESNQYQNNGHNQNDIKRLYRSRMNKMLCGVCGGIANYFGCDATIVRLLLAFLAFCSCGTAIIAYLVMAIVVPETPFNE